MIITEHRVTLPAGEYLVGDPAYAEEDMDTFRRWLDAVGHDVQPAVYAADGWPLVAVETCDGLGGDDAVYYDSDDRGWPTDTGLLGVVDGTYLDTTPDGMRRITFPHPFDVYADGTTVHIGDITIDTATP